MESKLMASLAQDKAGEGRFLVLPHPPCLSVTEAGVPLGAEVALQKGLGHGFHPASWAQAGPGQGVLGAKDPLKLLGLIHFSLLLVSVYLGGPLAGCQRLLENGCHAVSH